MVDIFLQFGLLIATSIVSAFVGLFIFLTFEDSISSFLARKFRGFFRRRRRIDGLWLSVYWRNGRSAETKPHVHILGVSTFGKRVFCDALIGQGHEYFISGKLSTDQYLTANWENKNPEVVYKGAVQFRLSDDTNYMSGKWIGWNRKGGINSGPWFAVKLPDSASTLATREDIL